MKRVRPRPLVASRYVAPPPRAIGGGHSREELVDLARASIAQGSQSFAAASLLFDPLTRERAHLLYAWCRRCDDIADGQDHGGTLDDDRASARDRVAALRVLTDRALAGQPTAEAAFDALGQVAAECRLDPQDCHDVLEGFALDAAGWRPHDEGDLLRYCYHVAGAVGVLMARVMGVAQEDEDTLDAACDLGLAFQLANIARDVAEDAAAGRCYIPQGWLAEAGIAPDAVMAPEARPALVALVARMLDMAQAHEAQARVGARALRFRRRWAVLAAANIYGAIGRKVRRAGPRAWDARVRTGAIAKLGHVLAALGTAIWGARAVAALPQWRRGDLLLLARLATPPAPMPLTPLRDEGVRLKQP